MKEERKALMKSAKNNFVGGYVGLHTFSGIDPNKAKEIGENLFNAFKSLVNVIAKQRNK